MSSLGVCIIFNFCLITPVNQTRNKNEPLQACRVADNIGAGVYFNTLVPFKGQVGWVGVLSAFGVHGNASTCKYKCVIY